MAGKEDLVNGIVDRSTLESRKFPYYDGWGQAESVGKAPYEAGNAAPGGSLVLDPLDGG